MPSRRSLVFELAGPGAQLSQCTPPSRSRVWSEPSVVDAAAFEFAETAKFLDAGKEGRGTLSIATGREHRQLLPQAAVAAICCHKQQAAGAADLPLSHTSNLTCLLLLPVIVCRRGDRRGVRVGPLRPAAAAALLPLRVGGVGGCSGASLSSREMHPSNPSLACCGLPPPPYGRVGIVRHLPINRGVYPACCCSEQAFAYYCSPLTSPELV